MSAGKASRNGRGKLPRGANGKAVRHSAGTTNCCCACGGCSVPDSIAEGNCATGGGPRPTPDTMVLVVNADAAMCTPCFFEGSATNSYYTGSILGAVFEIPWVDIGGGLYDWRLVIPAADSPIQWFWDATSGGFLTCGAAVNRNLDLIVRAIRINGLSSPSQYWEAIGYMEIPAGGGPRVLFQFRIASLGRNAGCCDHVTLPNIGSPSSCGAAAIVGGTAELYPCSAP